jgi:hypothetical protein
MLWEAIFKLAQKIQKSAKKVLTFGREFSRILFASAKGTCEKKKCRDGGIGRRAGFRCLW